MDRLLVYLGEALGFGDRDEWLERWVLAQEELREHPRMGELRAADGTKLDFFTSVHSRHGDRNPLQRGEWLLALACPLVQGILS